VKCDLVTLDGGLKKSYIKVLEDGKKVRVAKASGEVIDA
jgi:hypothetical protein